MAIRGAAPLGEDGKAAVGVAAGRGYDAFGDFLLEHQGEASPWWRPVRAREPADEERSADVVGQVGGDVPWGIEERFGRDLGGVALDHGELAGKSLREFGERGKAAAVHFDGSDAGAAAQERARKAARAGADFEDVFAVQVARDER